MDELKQTQEKHKNVKLVYEKVLDNIKSLCKFESKKESDTIIPHDDSSAIHNNSTLITEDELCLNYSEFLENTKKRIDELFLIHSKDEFMDMMRERGIQPIYNDRNFDKKQINKKSSTNLDNKVTKGDLIVNTHNNTLQNSKEAIDYVNEEYDYYDEDVKKEDDAIRKIGDEIIKEFMAIVF
jgi:hypothetical protein